MLLTLHPISHHLSPITHNINTTHIPVPSSTPHNPTSHSTNVNVNGRPLFLLPPYPHATRARRKHSIAVCPRSATCCCYILSAGTFLSRASVARMKHIWLSSPDQGGDIQHNYHAVCSHCVLLSALTYAPSPTPHPLITQHKHTNTYTTQVRF